MIDGYESPRATVLGEVGELTAGTAAGVPDQADGLGSTEEDTLLPAG